MQENIEKKLGTTILNKVCIKINIKIHSQKIKINRFLHAKYLPIKYHIQVWQIS